MQPSHYVQSVDRAQKIMQYIKLSDESRSDKQTEGNLSFPSSHCSRMITPKEGMVVLFPSYLPHETIPLIKDHERICIAFNLV